MTTMEGIPAGSVGDIGPLGDEWAFTLYDHEEREILAFVFHTESDARAAARMMQDVLARAVALSPAEERGFVAVPIVKG
jgi:hypothetical protein